MRWSSFLRAFLLAILVLVPWCTLVHRNELGRWDVQRSAMAAPDEFSYLLMARHFMHGGGLSLQSELGRDTFYPPGYPLLLAGWGSCFGLTTFTAHALNTALLSGCVLIVYFLSRRLLKLIASRGHRRFALSPNAAAWLALLVTGIFATNWHVLETSLLIMSEPAFMLVTFAWLALALRWPDWPTHPRQAAIIGLLAIAAWSIRGAGIVCVATTVLYPLLDWWRARNEGRAPNRQRPFAFALAIAFPLAYQALLILLAPEKSLASGNDAANSYTQQLLHGLIVHVDPNEPHPLWAGIYGFLMNLNYLVFSHLDDFGNSFVPWLRENPDFHFRNIIGKIFGLLALGGFAWHAARSLRTLLMGRRPSTAPPEPTAPATTNPHGGIDFLMLFLLFYIALYLIWPFNMPRFWSPILPIMLILAADVIVSFGAAAGWRWPSPTRLVLSRYLPAGTLLTLLLALAAVEDITQLGNYARRLNYVSDALAGSVRAIIRASPDAKHTLIAGLGEDELYILAWYLAQEPGGAEYEIRIPLPHVAALGGRGEHADALLLRCAAEVAPSSERSTEGKEKSRRLFFFCYFPGIDAHDTLTSFSALRPDEITMKLFQHWNIVTVWEIEFKPASTQVQMPLPAAATGR